MMSLNFKKVFELENTFSNTSGFTYFIVMIYVVSLCSMLKAKTSAGKTAQMKIPQITFHKKIPLGNNHLCVQFLRIKHTDYCYYSIQLGT